MEQTSQNQTPTDPEQPKLEDPLDALRKHVVAAQKYGYKFMIMRDIIDAIDRAKEGKLGDFRPEL